MKPYYSRDGITLYHADCRELLATMPAGSVDAVVTDPPYGIAACNRSDGGVGSIASGSKFYGRQKWDLEPVADETIEKISSVASEVVIWGGNYYTLGPATCWLIWNKMQRGFTFADAELAWTNLSRAVRIFDFGRGQLVSEGKVHPTQKPIPLIEWCIALLRGGACIGDFYAGSCTTGVAAWNLGRKAILCEISEEYCEIGAKRLDRVISQGRLFKPEPVQETQKSLFLDEDGSTT